ncbi:hypothetical protein HK405_015067, partial [Cladochytrium tenue]
MFPAVEARRGRVRRPHEVATARAVLPHYFDDCLRIRRLVREALYVWPAPRLFDDPFAAPAADEAPVATDQSPVEPLFLSGATFFLHPGVLVELGAEGSRAAKAAIASAGGALAPVFDAAVVTCAV